MSKSSKRNGNYKFIATFFGSILGLAGIAMGVILVLQPQLLNQKAAEVRYTPNPSACGYGLHCQEWYAAGATKCTNSYGNDSFCCPLGMEIRNNRCFKPTPSPKPCGNGLHCGPFEIDGGSKCLNESTVQWCCPGGQQFRKVGRSGYECFRPTPSPKPCGPGLSCGGSKVDGSSRCSQGPGKPILNCCPNGLEWDKDGCFRPTPSPKNCPMGLNCSSWPVSDYKHKCFGSGEAIQYCCAKGWELDHASRKCIKPLPTAEM